MLAIGKQCIKCMQKDVGHLEHMLESKCRSMHIEEQTGPQIRVKHSEMCGDETLLCEFSKNPPHTRTHPTQKHTLVCSFSGTHMPPHPPDDMRN